MDSYLVVYLLVLAAFCVAIAVASIVWALLPIREPSEAVSVAPVAVQDCTVTVLRPIHWLAWDALHPKWGDWGFE